MATILTPPRAEREQRPDRRRPSHDGGGRVGNGDSRGGNGGDGEPREPDPRAEAVQRYRLGMWIGLGGVVMVFAAFTSALVVRKGLGGDWRPFDLPGILWVSTAVLLASSFSIEKARRWMWRRRDQGLQRWMSVTGLLGAAFLASQLLAWRELADRGIYLASNPSSSFFYLLTAAHGVHLLGGIMAMSYVLYRLWRRRDWVTREAAVEATALYWHFMDGLWIYLLVLLMVWR